MSKVYFDAPSSTTVAGRAAGKIVDLLNFSFFDKMVAWSSFLVSRCQEPSYTMLPVTDPFFLQIESGVKNGPIFTYDCSHKQ